MFFIAVVVVGLWVGSGAPSEVHYVDGAHNDKFAEDRTSLASHSCAQLLKLYGSGYGHRPAIIPQSRELNELAQTLTQEVRKKERKKNNNFFLFLTRQQQNTARFAAISVFAVFRLSHSALHATRVRPRR
jgi:hypothetical protein